MLDVFQGSVDEPTPLLPLMALKVPLGEIEELVCECNASGETHEDRSRWLEAVLIEERLHMTELGFVEWGPDWALGDAPRASVFSWTMRVDIDLLLVRWDEKLPHWWSYGEMFSHSDWFEDLVENLEAEVGRPCSRAVARRPEVL